MEKLKPDATGIYVAGHQAPGAIEEAIEAEVPLIVVVAEHIPIHDMLRVRYVTGSRYRMTDGSIDTLRLAITIKIKVSGRKCSRNYFCNWALPNWVSTSPMLHAGPCRHYCQVRHPKL